jgi:aminoglycoside phosphotransferase (APT) family kinase protein
VSRLAAPARGADGLRSLVEEAVAGGLREGARVASVASEPSPFAGRSPAEVVSVGFEDGASVRLFVKRLRPDAHPDKRRRDREPAVYRELLAGRGLPAPRCYAARPDGLAGGWALVLEHVDGWSLKYHGLEQWTVAAGRLGELHAHFAGRADDLAAAGFLLRLDAAHFAGWAERAVRAAGAVSADLGRAAARALRAHDEAARLVAAQPPTLVHNDLAPKNVMADTAASPARIAIVDWEMAGVGCGLLDLAHLAHGLSAPEARRMLEAYADGRGAGLPRGGELDRLVAACELLNGVHRLAHAREWGLAPARVAADVAELRTLAGAAAP